MRGVRKNGLDSLVGQTIVAYYENVVADDNTKLWHYRLTHISQKGWMSQQNKMVLGKADWSH